MKNRAELLFTEDNYDFINKGVELSLNYVKKFLKEGDQVWSEFKGPDSNYTVTTPEGSISSRFNIVGQWVLSDISGSVRSELMDSFLEAAINANHYFSIVHTIFKTHEEVRKCTSELMEILVKVKKKIEAYGSIPDNSLSVSVGFTSQSGLGVLLGQVVELEEYGVGLYFTFDSVNSKIEFNSVRPVCEPQGRGNKPLLYPEAEEEFKREILSILGSYTESVKEVRQDTQRSNAFNN